MRRALFTRVLPVITALVAFAAAAPALAREAKPVTITLFTLLPLGNLWRPGSTPDRTSPVTLGRDPQRVSTERKPDTPPVVALVAVMGGIFLITGMRGRRPQAAPTGPRSPLLAQLNAWRRRRDGST